MNGQQLSTLSALAATVSALPTPAASSAETRTIEARQSCVGGAYFNCVATLGFTCNAQCLAVHDPIGKLTCLQRCQVGFQNYCRDACHN